MSEEKNQPVKPAFDDKKKNALLRYVAIMFAVAFLLVLLSMLSQVRANRTAINQLNQSSNSWFQKAEQLQDTNQILEENNELLKGEISDLTKQLEALEEQLEAKGDEVKALEEEKAELTAQSGVEAAKIKEAYELLLEAKAGSAEAAAKLETKKASLGPKGLETYEAIVLEKGE